MELLWSALIAVVLISGGIEAASVNSLTSECEYFVYNFPDWPLLQSLVPSVDAACLEVYNKFSDSEAGDAPSWCAVECQSLYNLYSRCIGQYYVDLFMSAYCGNYSNVPCYLYENYTYLYDVYSLCNSSTSCSAPCRDATVALENYSGCCTSDTLNGPKVLCGGEPVAPCTTPFANGDRGVHFSSLALVIAVVVLVLVVVV